MKDDTGSAVQSETRRLAAIMFTDMVGFSRQMGADETRMLRVLAVHNQVIQQAITEHHGHVIKTLGDAFVVDFPSVVHAVQCAQHVQARFRRHNAEAEKEEQIHVRIGIHLGDIIQQNGDVLGDGVNIASRLQTLTEPDTICVSQAVYQEVEKKLPLGTVVSLGRPKLKNIAQRLPVYTLLAEKPKGVRQRLQVLRLKARRVGTPQRMVVAALLLIVGTIVAVRYLSLPVPNPQPPALFLVLRLIHQPALLQPGHHRPQPGPHLFYLVVFPFPAQLAEVREANTVLGDPLIGELARLNVRQKLLHDLAGLRANDPFTPGHIPVLGRVANGVAHVRDAALIDQVNNELHLMNALKVGHLWCIARLDQRFKAGPHKLSQATTQN